MQTLGLEILRPVHEAEQVQFLLGQVNFELSSYVAVLSCSLFQETLKATTYTVDILLSVEDRSGPIIIIESDVEVILFMSSDVIIGAEI